MKNFYKAIFQAKKEKLAFLHQSTSLIASRRSCLWAATRREKQEIENKLRPLLFRNSFRNIQNIKNGLRIICCAPHPSPFGDSKPPQLPLGGNSARKAPQGEGLMQERHIAENKLRPLIFRNSFRNIQKIKNGLRPSSPPLRGRASRQNYL